MNITSRANSIAAEQQYYFTGKPCRKGHVSYRYTCSSNCYDCSLVRRQPDKDLRAAARRIRCETPKPLGKKIRRREEVSLSVADEFIEVFQETVLAMSQAKDRRLTLSTVKLSHRGKRSTTDKDMKTYRFKVFPEDYNAVLAFAANLYELWRREETSPISTPRNIMKISTRSKKWLTLRTKQEKQK